MNKIIEVQHVSKSYGYLINKVKVLEDLSFTVEKGEFVGIMGPSGAGKSTLLNVISTIDLPTAGIVRINGKNILELKSNQLSDFRRQEIGFIFQEFNLVDSLTIKDNILLPLAIDHIPLEEMDSRLHHVAELLNIEANLNDYPNTVSVGQKQRAAAARALITKPLLIFADEPTGSLDSKAAAELLQYLTEINRQDGATIIMVTHDPYTASYCDRVLFIKDGSFFAEVVRQGAREKFFNQVIDMQATIGGGTRLNDF
ncbi:ABC transporter ATP-binding protein [Enterococcus sp. BWB1-3]|uniref:ABC transporter ATP-binding protein n=1 Tax=unclassified Enterococcus TaxID=2608891 RepID=UPI001923535C|nr:MULTISPECIES: ABC transporter ATP-binding protein [unclassified Enterococcus]MBL1228972.1 ABC transporter ATP-binding protein [Enterococcus sp. BWB1-3]MCB5952241.1 ABC transporter ATP-binding protein [Enterococcus sp. BWT-B8]MCB5956389.1 ABC transporter ATP-binding protein [Enterococcus sp. CWB-B31]